MANAVLFIGWNRPIPGREQQAMGSFQKGGEYWAKLQSEGKIESFEPVLLAAHGGDLNGFVLIKGDAEKLAALRQEDTFIEISTEAGYCLEGFGIISGLCGEGIADAFSRYSKLISK